MKQECGSCRHYEQGPGFSFCSHPKQDNKAYLEYSYWYFGQDCQLWEEGTHPSRKVLPPFEAHKSRRFVRKFRKWWDTVHFPIFNPE